MSKDTTDLTKEFDSYWKVDPSTSSYRIFLNILEQYNKILPENYIQALKQLAEKYREHESKRWQDESIEKYHTHGLFSAWIAAKIILENYEKIKGIILEEISQKDDICFKKYNDSEKIQLYIFATIAAVIIHDFGAIKKAKDFGASLNQDKLENLGSQISVLKDECWQEVKGIAQYSNYDDPKSPVYIDLSKYYKFSAPKIPLNGLILIVSDLFQIGAFDYQERLKDIGLKPNYYPNAFVKLIRAVLMELSGRLEREINDFIPKEIAPRVLEIIQ